ncbi:D-Ala-D-Ala carboxypeptidase family metallohydrolase [Halomonas sp.]|uniref:D-Ala-D-Ala carboxypeptidase family metallohydrolase n=1 Tax=Halomonas sp. TaxID=1486246 RepID=UPI00298EBBF4|nr:D-Ala-D-Ala carboxypeptidase family metallohydrolase [Halomonas sp.]MDW7746568.1 D-Ala-D-Ala carboxypeptidase family metallohydrolase [Halomonas sp.]
MISRHFKRAEFACSCGCGFDTVDQGTLEILEAVRTHFGAPVIVTSGCRCPAHNATVGGVPNSQHVLGRAADIKVRNAAPLTVRDYIARHFPQASLGLYATFVHVDTRSNGPARWPVGQEG